MYITQYVVHSFSFFPFFLSSTFPYLSPISSVSFPSFFLFFSHMRPPFPSPSHSCSRSFLFTRLIDKSHGRTATVSMQLILHTTFYKNFLFRFYIIIKKKKIARRTRRTIYENIKRLLSRIIFVEERAYRLRIYDTHTIVLTTI